MPRKKHFLEGLGLACGPRKINPKDVIYRKGKERPSDEEIIKEVQKNEIKHNRLAIHVSGIIILAVACKVFGVPLPLPILLIGGAILGSIVFFVDRWLVNRK